MKDRLQPENRIRTSVQTALLLLTLLTALPGLTGCGGVSGEKAAGSGAQTEESAAAGEDAAADEDDGAGEAGGYQTVVWQGETYDYNTHLSNFLFLGVDKREIVETETGRADAGQADALYLVSYDRVSGKINLITIPRDTMTQIEVFDRDGGSLGLTEQHISLSYGYGDGGYGSLELAGQAVSTLFYGLPVQSSCAMSMDGLAALLESFGPVTVTVPNDSLAERFPEFQEGAEATLTEQNVETFVRWRDINTTLSALDRTERQQAFLQAFRETAKERYADNPGGLLDVYESLTPYLVTTIGNDWFLKLVQSGLQSGNVTEWTVPGEGVKGNPFDEYHVDDSAFYEQIMTTFYEKRQDHE